MVQVNMSEYRKLGIICRNCLTVHSIINVKILRKIFIEVSFKKNQNKSGTTFVMKNLIKKQRKNFQNLRILGWKLKVKPGSADKRQEIILPIDIDIFFQDR